MTDSPAAKRARTHFLWRRILGGQKELPTVTLKESPNVPVLRMMLDMNRDDDDVRNNLSKMEEYEKEITAIGGRTAYYEQKEIPVVGGYNGCKLIGRSYTSSKLNWLPRRITNTMYKMTHTEIDIKCCYPTMLKTAFDHLDLPVMSLLVSNPETIYKSLEDGANITRKQAKTVVLSMISSYPNFPYDYGVGVAKMDVIQNLSTHQFIRSFKNDLKTISDELKFLYPDFYKCMEKHCQDVGKLDRVEGIAMCYLAMDMENSVMRKVIDYFDPVEHDMIWYFDGILVPSAALRDSGRDEIPGVLSRMIKDEFGIECKFGVKDISENSIAWCLSLTELTDQDSYKAWKAHFERTFCRFSDPPKFGMLMDGKMYLYSKLDFNHVTMEQNKDMLNKWLNDPSKRSYKKLQFSPPPLICAPSNYNEWGGFAVEKVDPIVDDAEVLQLIQPYRNHVSILMGNNDQYAEYFHKLIAFKFQKPGLKWGIMPLLRSCQGVGKDQWFRFISMIVGSHHCLGVTNISNVMGKSTGLMENKLFVCFSEISFEDSRKHEEDLKRMITEDKLVIEKKYIPQYENTMTACFIGFSNNFNCIKFGSDDRRYFPVTCSGKYRNDPEYHGPFNDYILEKKHQRAVYQWYMEMDVEGFVPMHERPITDTHIEMATDSKPPIDIFLEKSFEALVERATQNGPCEKGKWDMRIAKGHQEGIVEVTSSTLFDEIEKVFLDLKIANMESRTRVEKYGSKQLRELGARVEKYKTGDQLPVIQHKYKKFNAWQFDVEAVRQYMTKDLGIGVGDNDEGTNMDVDRDRHEYSVHHNDPGKPFKYVVKDNGVPIRETNNLEEANMIMGEAYVTETLGSDGKIDVTLIHQKGGGKVYKFGPEYSGSDGKTRLEMRYPWYRKSRIN